MSENLFTSIATENFKPAIHPEFPVLERDKFVDVSIHHTQTTPIYPTNHINAGQGVNQNFLEFIINESPNNYIDLSSILIDFKLEVIDSNNGREKVDTYAKKFHFINNIISTIFPVRKVFMNGTPVENEFNGSHINYLKAILDSDKEHVRRYGTPLGCFIEDTIYKGNEPAAFQGEM